MSAISALLLLLLITVVTSTYPISQDESYFKRYIDKDPNIDMNGPNARTISNLLGASNSPAKSSLNLSMIEVFLAQFITHDIERVNFNSTVYHTEVSPGDSVYGVNATNNFIRQELSVGQIFEGDEDDTRFETRNFNTDALDLSNIYGSDAATHAALREFSLGKMKTSSYTIQLSPFFAVTYENMPPSQAVTNLTITTPITSGPSTVFTAGDDRVNENIALSIFDVVWVRNHNYHANLIGTATPWLNDQQMFEAAAQKNRADWQQIVMYEYVPTVLGSLAPLVKEYKGYDSDADIRTSVEFGMAAFRYGHSTVAQWDLIQANGSVYVYTIPAGVFGPFPISSSQLSFSGQLGGPQNPTQTFLLAGGIGNIVRGLVSGKADDSDIVFNNVARNIVFGGSIGRAVDLLTLDIVRSRNSGTPNYYELRKKFFNIKGLEKDDANIYSSSLCTTKKDLVDDLSCFSLITSDITRATLLQSIYGKVNKIDGIVGILSEDKYPGSLFSRTLGGILIKEYEQKRAGDVNWFENILDDASLETVRTVKLSHIFRRNLNLPYLPENILVV